MLRSFRTKLLIAITLMSVSLTGGSAYFYYRNVYQTIWKQTALRLMDIGRTGQFLFTPELREHIRRLDQDSEKVRLRQTPELLAKISAGSTGDSLSESQVRDFEKRTDFQAVIQALRRIKHGTKRTVKPLSILPQKVDPNDRPGLKFAYLLVRIPESPDLSYAKFIADGDYEQLDANNNGKIDDEEASTSIGMIYNITRQPGMRRAFAGEVAANDEYYRDQWGMWFSAYTPILDKDGKVLAVLGIDMSVASEFNLVERLKRTLYFVIAGAFVVSILVAYVLAYLLARPIRILQQGAQRVQQRDFNTQITLPNKDEFGDLAGTFNSMIGEIKQYAGSLEEMVATRTRELEETLGKVQELKNQQDADYYLTTMLTTPLFKNRNRSETVTIEFLMEQKKKFQFKHWNSELGGDLCVSGNLNFSGVRHVMFFNGDAMGKSMQGAGGALVMGALVNSIMARSAANQKVLSSTPQEWLEETYHEIQRVFEAFDGTMYVSCILGLVDEQSGHVFMWNAEHPEPVLLRNGRASFLFEEQKILRKIGIPQQTTFAIEEFQLEPGDQLVLGSDGRDDLLLGQNEDGTRIINENEHLFLEVVQDCQGDLGKVAEELAKRGALTDDLSLLSIAFSGGAVPKASDKLGAAVAAIKNKNYEAALAELSFLAAGENYLIHYYRGVCLSKLGHLTEALTELETALGLSGEHDTILKLSATVCMQLDLGERALDYARRALAARPGDPKLERLVESITARTSA